MKCSHCGRDIDAIGQDNMSSDPSYALCEDCFNNEMQVMNEQMGVNPEDGSL